MDVVGGCATQNTPFSVSISGEGHENGHLSAPEPGHAGLFMAGCLWGRGFIGEKGLSGQKQPAQSFFADTVSICPKLSPNLRIQTLTN
jgi:hypothetical protein